MCGIGGVVRLDGRAAEPEALSRMATALGHRGPDGDGVLIDGPIGLCHRRLAIIDPQGSAQPMSTHNTALHISFNGEVLNYRQLRAQLDYDFATDGDTEVLLAQHLTKGPAGAAELIGQFAYALYDARSGLVYLTRDAMGILPLYYLRTSDAIWFASEIKGLIAAIGCTPPVDSGQLASYLRHRYVPAPHTLFEGVRKVPAGHWMAIGPAGIGPAISFITPPPAMDPIPTPQVLELLDSALNTAVARNLVADVPVGAFLSGGLDSSLLTSLAVAQRPDDRLSTFSAGFEDPQWNELPYARSVANALDTDHHEITVVAEDFERLLAPLTWARDAPISEASDIPLFMLAQLAREHVKVALSGEGADELFGGYPKYRFAALTRGVGLVPSPLRAASLGLLDSALPAKRWRVRTAVRALAPAHENDRYQMWFDSFSAAEAAALTLGRRRYEPRASGSQRAAVRRMMQIDTESWLPDNLLERADRMAMAASLEVRPPYLDLDVVALSRRLTRRQLVRGGDTKWLLKRYARDRLPSGIADRVKLGFRVPVSDWFRGRLRDTTRGRLLDPGSFAAQVLDASRVRALLDRHDQGIADEGPRIWALLALEVWHEAFYGANAISAGFGM